MPIGSSQLRGSGSQGIDPLIVSTAPPIQTDHDLLVALNEQVYDLRKELRSLHRLMAAMKKTLRHGLPSVQPSGDLQSTHADVTMSDASYHDPLFELDMDSIGE